MNKIFQMPLSSLDQAFCDSCYNSGYRIQSAVPWDRHGEDWVVVVTEWIQRGPREVHVRDLGPDIPGYNG